MIADPMGTGGVSKPRSRVMVDIETLGTAPGSVILSIGAARAVPSGGAGQYRFEIFGIHIDPDDSVMAGMTIDPATVLWWLEQGDDARREVVKGAKAAVSLDEALKQFSQWLGDVDEVWACGPDFDLVLITDAYARAGMPVPWRFWQQRCFRTLRSQWKHRVPEPSHKLEIGEIGGAKHVAVNDAVQQLVWMLTIEDYIAHLISLDV
jgi:hypothetical protein